MSSMRHGLAPKMKPLSPKRSALIAALDIGTSKIACLIARLKPQPPQDVLRRRSHSVEIIGIGHTRARGIKSGSVIDLGEAEEAVRQAVSAAERMGGVEIESVLVSVSAGRIGSDLYSATVHVPGPTVNDADISRVLAAGSPPFAARRPRRAAFAADRLCARRRPRHPRSARHARRAVSASTCMSSPPTCPRCAI